MTKTTRTKQVTEELFIANDGTEFNEAYHCKLHEWKSTATKVYTVYARGKRANFSEIYSTLELAKEALASSSAHNIVTSYLNERFWLREWEASNG